MPAGQPPPPNTLDPEVLLTHLDIFLRADFQSNRIPTVVKATLENTSTAPVDKVAFLLCTTPND